MDDKQIREELKKFSPDDRALWRTLRHCNTIRGHEFKLEELWQVFLSRPQYGGIFECSYYFDDHTWKKAFKKKIRKQLVKASGVSSMAVRRNLMPFDSLTFEQALEKLQGIRKPEKPAVTNYYGERFGVFRVVPDSAKVSKKRRVVVVKCVYCGAQKTIRLYDLKNNSQTCFCGKCGAGKTTKPIKNSANYARRPLNKPEYPEEDMMQIALMSLGWFSIATVTSDFSERYVDCMLDAEARKIWMSIHGEQL